MNACILEPSPSTSGLQANIAMRKVVQPLPDAASFTSDQLSLSFNDDRRRFSCFHCGNLPKRGDVLLIRMKSGRTGVAIVQSMDERSRVFTDTGLRFGFAEQISYLEDVTFEIPQAAKLGFIIG
jgi:hypothetical protein